MVATVASKEPEKLVAGDTLKFTKSVSDYAPEDSWVLSYALVSSTNQYNFSASDNGDGTHLVNVAAATTVAWVVGTYKWQAYVTKASERYSVGAGTLEVVSDFSGETSFDARAHCKKVLDAIELTIEGKASKDQQSYSISFGDSGASRSISRLSFGELIEARKFYKNEYQRLKRQERIANGLDSGRTIHIRMGV
jgi:hypothetical protein